MLSIAKKITHCIFSGTHYTRLQNLLSSETYNRHTPCNSTKNNDDDFVDIILDADFDKNGKTISLK